METRMTPLKKLKNVSASQIKTYRACKRKWHWEKIADFRGPPSEAMAKGTAIHHALEEYIKTGVILDNIPVDKNTGNVVGEAEAGTAAMAAGTSWLFKTKMYVDEVIDRGFIPKGAIAEAGFAMPTVANIPCLGYVDVHVPPTLQLKDWKTTSNIRYALTPTELHEDIQANIYARWYLTEVDAEAEFVDVSFVYLETKLKTKTKSLEVTTRITRAEAEEYWAALQITIAQMAEDALLIKTVDLEPTTSHCSAYGGCSHRGRCGLGGLDAIYKSRAEVKPKKMSQKIGMKMDTKTTSTPATSLPTCLYVDCVPMKGATEYVLFEEWIQPAIGFANQAAEAEGVPDWRMMGYSPEKMAFQKAVERLVQEKGLPSAMVIPGWHPQAKEALAVLMLHADNVVWSRR